MTLYSDTTLPIPTSTESLHRDELHSFARPGTWGTATQRTAIAAHARKVRCEAGIQESIGDEALADLVELPEPARRVARAVALGGIEIDRKFCEQAQADGVTEGAYVEIVGLVARISHLDVFARGIGVPSRKLGDPVEDKEPSMERPSVAKKEGFYTASVPSAPEGGELAVLLYGSEPAGNIERTLSLVPDEARRLNTLIEQEYFSGDTMFNLTYSSQKGLSRPQLELVAAKVSELNQCFYWTTWHTYVLRESGKASEQDINLAGVFDTSKDSGIANGRELIAFANGVIGANLQALNVAREALAECMGADAVVSVPTTAAVFSLLDRAANGIGIDVEPMVLETSEDFREQFGINRFPSAANTLG